MVNDPNQTTGLQAAIMALAMTYLLSPTYDVTQYCQTVGHKDSWSVEVFKGGAIACEFPLGPKDYVPSSDGEVFATVECACPDKGGRPIS